jgi:hypothetical protein
LSDEPGSARALLLSHPEFASSVRRTAGCLVELHQGNRLLNMIVNDRGRLVVSMIALDLYFRREVDGLGLTPSRLKAVCIEQKVCSATRAGALLALMRFGEYVAPTPVSDDRRRRELVPTERLIAAQRERWRCQFAGAASLMPEAAEALAAIDRPEFMPAMLREVSAHFYAGFRLLDLCPALRLFGERNGGMFVVLMLLAAADYDAIRNQSPIPISVSFLARRIGSSRAHVIKLLRDAEEQGLIERPSPGTIVLLPRLVRESYDFFSITFLFLCRAAKDALKA